jgi:VWFA-related protein
MSSIAGTRDSVDKPITTGAIFFINRHIIRALIACAIFIGCARIIGAQSDESASPQTLLSPATIPAGRDIVLQLDTSLNTFFSKKGDEVEFHTAADVIVDNLILIPNQSLVRGKVKKSKRSGALGGPAEIQLTLLDVRLPDRTVLPFEASIFRSGPDLVKDSKIQGDTRVNGAITAGMSAGIQGALVGLLYGGARGAIYGGAIGAATSIINPSFKRGPDIDLPASTIFEARLKKSLTIPALAVMAQNGPPVKSVSRTEIADLNTAMDASLPANSPMVMRPQMEAPIGEASISAQTPDANTLFIDGHIEEPAGTDWPIRPQSAKTTEEAAIFKTEPRLNTPTNPRTTPREEATSDEPAGEGVKISVTVKMVQVDAVVRSRSGNAIANLGMQDFKVYDNNVLQQVVSFSQDRLPIAVAIVVDRSGSVTPYLSELRFIASRALSNMKEQDEVCLFAFDQAVLLLEPLTPDRMRIANAINHIGGGGATNILDALYQSIQYLSASAPNRRHAVILISDNQQTVRSMASEQDVITVAQESDTMIYSLKTGASPLMLGNILPNAILGDSITRVANDSGGELFKVTKVEALDSALNAVISRLRTSYSIGYYPSNSQSGAFHSITLRLTDKFGKSGSDYSIQAKKGYYSMQPNKPISAAKPF